MTLFLLVAPGPAQATNHDDERTIYMIGFAPIGRGTVPYITLDLTGQGVEVTTGPNYTVTATNPAKTVNLILYFGSPHVGWHTSVRVPVLLQGTGTSTDPNSPYYAESWEFVMTEYPGTTDYTLDATFTMTVVAGIGEWSGTGWLEIYPGQPGKSEEHPLVFAGIGAFG